MYKRQSEPDSAYVLTPAQPRAGDTSVTVDNLEPGESYSLRLKAFHSGINNHILYCKMQILA